MKRVWMKPCSDRECRLGKARNCGHYKRHARTEICGDELYACPKCIPEEAKKGKKP
jgi:hypothetical protein